MRVYISGGMTGYIDNNYRAFKDMEHRLLELGNEVVNPADLGVSTMTWEAFMKEDIKYMMDCDAVVVLDGWEQSRGATVEVYLAIVLGMKVYNSSLEEINPAKHINKTTILTFITKKLI